MLRLDIEDPRWWNLYIVMVSHAPLHDPDSERSLSHKELIRKWFWSNDIFINIDSYDGRWESVDIKDNEHILYLMLKYG